MVSPMILKFLILWFDLSICTLAFAILAVEIASDLENCFLSFKKGGLYNIQLFALHSSSMVKPLYRKGNQKVDEKKERRRGRNMERSMEVCKRKSKGETEKDYKWDMES